jgi:pyridoxine 5-phosphate synthase
MSKDKIQLGVNVDHVATLRQARYRGAHAEGGATPEPSPLEAALICEKAGAHSITVHLREDRRHIQDEDVQEIRQVIKIPLNLEMAVTDTMTDYAVELRPNEVCLVPESRREVTTEGGLDVVSHQKKITVCAQKLRVNGTLVSLFIAPDLDQVKAAKDTGAKVIELHTGAYSNAQEEKQRNLELKKLKESAELAQSIGLQVNAGHGLNYVNTQLFVKETPHLDTLNIGHSIISRSITTGLAQAVQEMLALISKS